MSITHPAGFKAAGVHQEKNPTTGPSNYRTAAATSGRD